MDRDNENIVGYETPEDIRRIEVKLERLRKDMEQYTKYLKIAFVAMIFIFILSLFIGVGNGFIIPPYIIILGAFIPIIILKSRRDRLHTEYRATYKDEFIVRVLKEEFENVSYSWTKGFTKDEIELKQFVEMGNIYKSEDFLSAEYKGVSFSRSDVVIKNKRKRDDTPNIYFRGRVYDIDFNKRILGELQIRTKYFPHGITSQCLKRSYNIETENIEFSDTFDIRSTDEEAAFYVLTPHMQEHILSINKNYKSMCIKIEGSRLFIAANVSGGSFELSLKDHVIFENVRYNILRELREIKNIIDEMNLMDTQFLQIREDNQYRTTYNEKLNVHVVDKNIDEMFLGDIG